LPLFLCVILKSAAKNPDLFLPLPWESFDGLPWVQQPFPYQGKCLKWMREAREALSPADRAFVDAAIESTGADAIFS
jgi:hypothetical protein